MRALYDDRDVVARALAAADDRAVHTLQRMLGQQLQDANVLTRPGQGAVLFLQRLPQLRERGRQLPVFVDVGVIQSRRLPPEGHQVVQRIEHLHAARVRAPMARDDAPLGHHLQVFHIGLDGHRRKGVSTWHAVSVVIKTHGLVLVHLGSLGHTGVESARRQRQGGGTLALETLADRLRLPTDRACAVAQAARTQVGVQLGQVAHLGQRRGPVTL